MPLAYISETVSPASIRALNYTPEVSRLRARTREAGVTLLGSLACEVGDSYAKVLPRIDCSPASGRELLSQVDIFAAEPRGRAIRHDLIPFADNITIREGDILVAGVGQIGESTLFGRAVIADKRLAGKLASGDVLIIRFPEADAVIGRYVYAFLNSSVGLRAIRSCAYGTSIPRIRLDLLSTLPIPIPDTSTLQSVSQMVQDSIRAREEFAESLEFARSAINSLDEVRNAAKASAVRQPKCIIWDKELPTLSAWNYASAGEAIRQLKTVWKARLGDVLEGKGAYYGLRFSRIACQPPHGHDFLSQRDVFLIKPVPRRIASPNVPSEYLFSRKGSIVVAGRGTCGEGEIFGRTAIISGEMADYALTEDLLRIAPRSGYSGLVYAFLSTSVGFRLLRATAVGTKILNLRNDLLRTIPIPELSSSQIAQIDEHIQSSIKARDLSASLEGKAVRIIEQEVLPLWLS